MTGSRQLIGGRFQVGDVERDLLGRGGVRDLWATAEELLAELGR